MEIGDQISTEMEIDDRWQGMCVFQRLRACACVYSCFWWVAVWPGGWLNRGITALLGKREGMGGRFSFLRGVPNPFLNSREIAKMRLSPQNKGMKHTGMGISIM